MAKPPQTINYSDIYNRLLTPDGELTPVGMQAMQRFNGDTAAGLRPMSAAQIIGGQRIEDPNFGPLQVQSS